MSNNDFIIDNGILIDYIGNDEHIIIPDGITEIRSEGTVSMFYGGYKRELKVTKITLPVGLKIIRSSAFRYCKWLTDICLPDGIEEIGESAFSHCEKLTAINIPSSVRKISDYAIYGCNSLTEIIIPEGVEHLGVISDCANLKKISIPKSVVSISPHFLGNCPELETIEVTNGNPVYHSTDNCLIETENKILIAGGVNCKIPEDGSVTTLGKSAFTGRKLKGRFVIPEGISKIEDYTFNDCTKLREIVFPSTVEYCGVKSFENTPSIKKVFAPNAESWCQIHFDESSGSKSNPLNSGAELYFGGKPVIDLIIPEGIKQLKWCTFSGCTSIKSVKIPKSAEYFGFCTFLNCANLKSVYVDSLTDWLNVHFGDSWGESFGNPLCNDGTLYVNHEVLTEMTVPEDITEIPDFSFHNNKSLQKVYLHDRVKSIGYKAFDTTTLLIMDVQGKWDLSKIPDTQTELSVVINKRDNHNEISEKIIACINGKAIQKDPLYVEAWNSLEELNLISNGSIDYNKYDSFILSGSKKFKLSIGGKLRAALYRLIYPVELDSTYKNEYISICQKGIKKLIPIAIEENDPEAIKILFEVGAIPEKDKKSILKLLASTPNDDIKELATMLDQDAPTEEKAKTESTPEDCGAIMTPLPALNQEYIEKLSKINGVKQIIKMGLTLSNLPDVFLEESGKIAPKEILQYILASYGAQYINSAQHHFAFIEDAEKAAGLLDTGSLQRAMDEVYQSVDVFEKPHVIVPYCRFADYKGITNMISNFKKWHSWYDYGAKGRKLELMAFEALMLSDSKEAMTFIDKHKRLDQYATMRGTDADTLRDTVLAEFGLDQEGKKVYDLGTKNIIVSLTADLTLSLFDEAAQKTVKSIPKKDTDPNLAEKAAADFAEMKKTAKKTVQGRNNFLFEDFLSGKTKNAKSWIAVYTQNPLLRQVAELIVWAQGKSTFTLTANGAIDCNEVAYTIDANTEIGVAHPIEMKKKEIEAWQKYFTSHGLKQPFPQIWEPAINKSTIQEDRYAGCMIPFYRFRNREKHGIIVEDYDFHNMISIGFKDCNADVERIDLKRHSLDNEDRFEVTSFKFKKYTRQVNHIVAYLDHITVAGRILKDDISVAPFLPQFTVAQITEFIKLASENNCPNVTALLLDYKNRTFGTFDPMDEFVLDL